MLLDMGTAMMLAIMMIEFEGSDVDGEYDDDCSANNVEHAVENNEHVLIQDDDDGDISAMRILLKMEVLVLIDYGTNHYQDVY